MSYPKIAVFHIIVQAQEEAAFLSTNPENRSLSKQHEFLFLFHTTLSPMTC